MQNQNDGLLVRVSEKGQASAVEVQLHNLAPGGPTVLRMILGRQLQGLRERAGMSYEQAAAAIYASAWTLRRMEKAEVGLKLNYVKRSNCQDLWIKII